MCIMNQKIEKQILTKIVLEKEGVLIFSEDFLDIASQKAVSKNLERLVNHNILVRVARGIYLLPKKDKDLGPLMPSIDVIAKAIAKRDGSRIVDSGIKALQKLGLSTQIPMNAVYLTDGSSRKIKVGNRYIIMKRTTTKNLALKGEISGLVVKAMKEIGKDKVTDNQMKKIQEFIKKENRKDLLHDARLAPIWIRDKLMKMIKDKT